MDNVFLDSNIADIIADVDRTGASIGGRIERGDGKRHRLLSAWWTDVELRRELV